MQPYTEILRALHQAEVAFIVAGGVACILHGVERITLDLDIIHMTQSNYAKFLAVMRQLNLTSYVPLRPEALLDISLVRKLAQEKNALVFSFRDIDKPYRQVDIFLTDELSYDSLIADTELQPLDGFAIRIVNRQRLLAIKRAILPPRNKDRLDIEYLEQYENKTHS